MNNQAETRRYTAQIIALVAEGLGEELDQDAAWPEAAAHVEDLLRRYELASDGSDEDHKRLDAEIRRQAKGCIKAYRGRLYEAIDQLMDAAIKPDKNEGPTTTEIEEKKEEVE